MAFLQSNLDRFNAIFFSVEYIIDTHCRQFIGRLAVNDEHQSHIAVRRLYGERQDEMVTCYAIKCVVVNPRHAGIQELRLNLEEREKLPFLCGNGLHRRLLDFFRRTTGVTRRRPSDLPFRIRPDPPLGCTPLFGLRFAPVRGLAHGGKNSVCRPWRIHPFCGARQMSVFSVAEKSTWLLSSAKTNCQNSHQ